MPADPDSTDPAAPGTAPAPGVLVGMLERADHSVISGWAADAADRTCRVELELLIDDEPAGTLPAHLPRDDLLRAGLGDGRHGFSLYLPRGISLSQDHVIRLRRAADGAELPGSPRTIPRDPGAERGLQQVVGDALDAAAARLGPAELDSLIADLARQTAELLLGQGSSMGPQPAALIERWGAVPGVLSRPDPRPHALFIDEAVPDPKRDAGSSAALSHMRALQRLGFRVDFVPAHGLGHSGPRSDALQALGITCWQAPWIGSVEEVLRRAGPGLAVAYLHRFGIMQRYAALVRRWCPQARLLYCVADLHFLRAARRGAVEAGLPAESATLTPDVAGLRTAELLAALGADATITHSSFEAELLRREVPSATVRLVPWEVVARPTGVTFLERHGVAFVGSYGHPPNLDAAHYLVETIMPLVWARDPTIDCVLAGSDLPASLRAAAERAPAGLVTVLGHIPSLAGLWDRVRLSAASLRFGAGLKGKVLDSLAGGIPCVCTPMAAEGMGLPSTLAALVADEPEAIAEAIVRLHNDEAENARLSAAAVAWIGESLSAEVVTAALRAAAIP